MRWRLECVGLQYVELKKCVELEELELLSDSSRKLELDECTKSHH